MKLNFVIVSSLILIAITGCEQKTAQPSMPAAAPKEPQSLPATAVKPNDTAALEAAPKTNKATEMPTQTAPQKVESSEQKATPIVKETTEQSLAEVAKHARELTKTQESKSRTRAQISEDEMLKDLEKFK